jgi:hypothetical protein
MSDIDDADESDMLYNVTDMKDVTKRIEKLGGFGSWRYIVNFWTFVFFIAIVYDFFNENLLSESEILLAVAGIYAATLAVYSAENEFRRWHHMHASIHPGEMYVILWTILMAFLISGAVFFDVPYHMPSEVSASYIGMIGILAITRESKNFYKRRNKKTKG